MVLPDTQREVVNQISFLRIGQYSIISQNCFIEECSLLNLSLLGACNIISLQNIHLMSRTGSPFSILKYTRCFTRWRLNSIDILGNDNKEETTRTCNVMSEI